MKQVILKKVSESELKPKILILKAEGKQFDEKTLQMLQIAMSTRLPLELNDEQVELLESLRLVESARLIKSNEEKTPNADVSQDVSEKVSQSRATVERREAEGEKNISEGITEPGIQTSTELESGERLQSEINGKALSEDSQEVETVHDEPTINSQTIEAVDGVPAEKEINANINVNVDEQLTEEDKTPKKEATEEISAVDANGFVPTADEAKGMSVEQSRKMYYLTPERVFESFKRLNGGEIWKKLGAMRGGEELQNAIKMAYKKCNLISDLMNPDFLDERISTLLPKNNQALEMKDFHMAALLGTYVGYHIEKNDGEAKDIDVDSDGKSNVMIMKLPMLVSEMPDSIKESISKDIGAAIIRRVSEIMNTSDSYRALKMLMPLELTLDKAIADYSEGLHDTEKNTAVKAYIKTIRSDMTDEMKKTIEDLNVSLDLYSVNWNNKDERQNVINMLGKLQDDGRGADVSKFVEEINMSFNVHSVNDLRAVEAVCEDLSQLSEQGIDVNIAFEIPAEQLRDMELQSGLEEIVNSYDNIERDYATELSTNGMNAVTDQIVQAALGNNPVVGAVNPAMNIMNPGPEGPGMIGMDPRLMVIAGLTNMATEMLGINIEQLIEGPERASRMPMGRGGV